MHAHSPPDANLVAMITSLVADCRAIGCRVLDLGFRVSALTLTGLGFRIRDGSRVHPQLPRAAHGFQKPGTSSLLESPLSTFTIVIIIIVFVITIMTVINPKNSHHKKEE